MRVPMTFIDQRRSTVPVDINGMLVSDELYLFYGFGYREQRRATAVLSNKKGENMIIFPSMLIPAAEKAGIKVPPNPDKFDSKEFPHFAVFCNAQLCRATAYHGEHWENAKLIADISEDDIKTITWDKLREMGFSGI